MAVTLLLESLNERRSSIHAAHSGFLYVSAEAEIVTATPPLLFEGGSMVVYVFRIRPGAKHDMTERPVNASVLHSVPALTGDWPLLTCRA